MESIGPYRLDSELGRGAMGVVFRAFDPAIGRPVAIKVTQLNLFATPSEKAGLKLQFAKEAAAAGKLSHPNIVTVYHLGEQDDLQYLVMELVDGRALEKIVESGQPLDRKMALSVLSQVADALDYAHGEGTVHGNVKPSNVLVRQDGRAKITGFGVARVSSQTVIGTGFTTGTAAYMAPEQIVNSRLDGRADQFSLAVIAYQMLSGRRPFMAAPDPEAIFKIMSEEAQPLHEIDRSFSSRTSDVLRKGLAKDPNQRFASCADFIKDLSDSLEEQMPAASAAAKLPAGTALRAPERTTGNPATRHCEPALRMSVAAVGEAPGEAAGGSGKRVWVAVVLALAALGVGGYGSMMLYPGFHEGSSAPVAFAGTSDLGLHLEHSGPDLLLTWDHDSFGARNGKAAKLHVFDGDIRQNYDIDRAQLSGGLGVVYTPTTPDVRFDMEVYSDRGKKIGTGSARAPLPR